MPAVPKPRAKPKRLTRMKRFNAKRQGHRFPKRRQPSYLAWLRLQRCVVCEQWGFIQETRSQAAHVQSRGAGGPDIGNAVSLCAKHHDEQHLKGILTFQCKYRVDLSDRAAKQSLRFLETGGKP